MELVKNYRNNDRLRNSFNRLTEEIFGFNFQNWYDNGFWNDLYIPYSMVENDEVVANVSVNIIDILDNDTPLHLIQLGTVMTKLQYRNKGLIRRLMNEIENDFANKVDGMFLFANDEVVSFYPKFGFKPTKEYIYSKTVETNQKATVRQIPMSNKADMERLASIINSSNPCGSFAMINNSDLVMFYISGFMNSNVYYDEQLNTYTIAEIDDNQLFIYSIYNNDEQIDINNVIRGFGSEINKVTLGFTPKCTESFKCSLLKEDDTTLFLKGFSLDNKRVMFPTLSHA